MRFKKIYVEITNMCNLNCDFCIKNDRKMKILSTSEFNIILDKIKPYTRYIYMHVLGEPMIHPNINEFISLANNKGFNVNITTNGYLIDKLNIEPRQINISLHSFNELYNKSLEEYMNNILENIKKFENTEISLRLWTKTKYKNEIINYLNNYYNVNIDLNKLEIDGNIKIKDKLYLNKNDEFIWPDINNNYYEECGKCYALKDHIGILSDGTIIPCCLDSKGIVKLGNIFIDNIESILNSDRVVNMLNGFKNNKKIEELCKHCKFLN